MQQPKNGAIWYDKLYSRTQPDEDLELLIPIQWFRLDISLVQDKFIRLFDLYLWCQDWHQWEEFHSSHDPARLQSAHQMYNPNLKKKTNVFGSDKHGGTSESFKSSRRALYESFGKLVGTQLNESTRELLPSWRSHSILWVSNWCINFTKSELTSIFAVNSDQVQSIIVNLTQWERQSFAHTFIDAAECAPENTYPFWERRTLTEIQAYPPGVPSKRLWRSPKSALLSRPTFLPGFAFLGFCTFIANVGLKQKICMENKAVQKYSVFCHTAPCLQCSSWKCWTFQNRISPIDMYLEAVSDEISRKDAVLDSMLSLWLFSVRSSCLILAREISNALGEQMLIVVGNAAQEFLFS